MVYVGWGTLKGLCDSAMQIQQDLLDEVIAEALEEDEDMDDEEELEVMDLLEKVGNVGVF